MDFKPSRDGIDHVNIYSRGETLLGRALSNFFQCRLDLGDDGVFESVEGYWYWLGTSHPDRDQLRTLCGYQAKHVGRVLRKGHEVDVPDFMERIERAIRLKVETYPGLKKIMAANSLPFAHYYVFDGFAKDAGHEWLPALAERIRDELRATPTH